MELERLLAEQANAPREMPAELRARLETMLTTGTWKAYALEAEVAAGSALEANPLEGTDVPRAMEPVSAERLEAALAREPGALFDGLDEPREMPQALRARVEAALARPARRRTFASRSVGMAAALMLVLAASAVVVRIGEPPLRPAETRGGTTGGSGDLGTTGAFAVPPPPPTTAPDAPPITLPPPRRGGGASSPAFSYDPGDPPPFAFDSFASTPAFAPSTDGGGDSPRGPLKPLRIGYVAGDDAKEAGFRAYITTLNRHGGAGGHPIDIVQVSPSLPALDVIATVNLSNQPVAGLDGPSPWAGRPIMENLIAAEAVLRGDVFDAASVPEHQAHLIADAVFPAAAPGTRAVIYYTRGEPYERRIPDAIDAVLRRRGVTAVRVLFDKNAPVQVVSSDAVFLSMPGVAAHAWSVDTAGTAGTLAADRGVAGIFSLFDEAIAGTLGDGVRVMSPYKPPSGMEAARIAELSRRPLSVGVLHGWTTAKTLAVAIWRHKATTAKALTAALRSLRYSSDVAPYGVRKHHNSRTQEGILLTIERGSYVADPRGFRSDDVLD